MKVNKKYIGCNFTGHAFIGGVISSYNGIFNKEEVLIGSGLDFVPCIMGDVSDAYEMLKEIISKNNAQNFEDICACIYQTVNTYFNGIKNINKRMSYYKDLDDIETEDDITRVSTLKGEGAAMCVERAMLAQNLLKLLNIGSFYKASCIERDGKLEIHAYNLIANNDKYYIFDSSIPTERNSKVSPLIGEIPKEVFDHITSPEQRIGYSVHINHYNPFRNNYVDITYDAKRQEVYNIEESNTKTK